MEYRVLYREEISRELFKEFKRYQKVTQCWRKVEDEWVIKDVPFIDEWHEEEYEELIKCLKNTIQAGGVVFGAFFNDVLKGFSSVESNFIGINEDYLDLSSMHVSQDMRGHGVGKELFKLAIAWAKEHGAKKLYISAHSAIESQSFYKAMGCAEAVEYNQEHVKREPCDCQLEYFL